MIKSVMIICCKQTYTKIQKIFEEDVTYRQINQKEFTKLCVANANLHKILTNAIFNYPPCCYLLQDALAKYKPSAETWATEWKKWYSLSAEPFHNVSKSQL